MSELVEVSPGVRSRIVAAAAALVASGGVSAATTRAVAAAASVQAPTIYRLFGDKGGLLDAVAEAELADYVASKGMRAPSDDPVEDLRAAWDDHVGFCLAHPAIFAMMNSPMTGAQSSAAQAGLAVLRQRICRVAKAGHLKVSEERAVDLVHASGRGAVSVLLDKPEDERAGLAEAARETVLAAIVDGLAVGANLGSVGPVASALRARLDETTALSPGEKHFLDELLQRMAERR